METQMKPSLFEQNLIRIIDSYDSLGVYRNFTNEQKIVRSFLLTKEEKQEMDSCGHLSEKYKAQITLFFQAVALTIEQTSGKMVSSILEVNDEGFGRAVLYSGRLVLLSKGLRGTMQFGYTKIEKALKEGEKYVTDGISWIQRYPEIVLL